jgi:hypothetical protein
MADAPNIQFKAAMEKQLRDLFAPKIPANIVDEFMRKLCIHDNKVCGFKYIDVKSLLSPSEFHELLVITGFDKLRQEDWDDQECNGRQCVPNFGHACDSVTCGH